MAYFKFLPLPEEHLESFLSGGFVSLSLIYNLSWTLIILLNNNQDLYIFDSYAKRVKDLIINAFILLGMSSTIILLAGLEVYPLTVLLGPIFLFIVLNLLTFGLLSRAMSRVNAQAGFGSRILVIGAGRSGKRVLSFAEQNKHLGYQVVGFLDDHYPASNGIQLLGRLDDLPKVLDDQPVDEIIIALPLEQQGEIKAAIEMADYRGIRVNLVPEYSEVVGPGFKSYRLGSLPVLQLK
ncbi:MAG: hypothetical protein D6722_04880, partial [Bacteroidetes bacterium]